jgi:hypothetical protein
MTWGLAPDSRRSAIGLDARYALFYEIFDTAWSFTLLHEPSHIENDDLESASKGGDGVDPSWVPRSDPDDDTDELTRHAQHHVDRMYYVGTGPNNEAAG